VTKLVLASGSPRRKELLERAGLELTVVPADIDESLRHGEDPLSYAKRLAESKARAVAERHSGATVLGADTIVTLFDGGPPILGKPAGAEEARVMITRLAGRKHQVVTAYHLISGERERGRAVETEVLFRHFSAAEVAGYVASNEWRGKAGGYAIQGLAGAFVRAVSGSYTNVVGLPLCEVLEDLAALGVLAPDWAARAKADT
jgi:septum formation protein